MSPRSAKRAPAKAGRGKPLPKPPVASFTENEKSAVFESLASLIHRLDNLPLTSAREEMPEYPFANASNVKQEISRLGGASPQPQPPVVKDRLSNMIDRLMILNVRLGSMENYLFSSPTPATAGNSGDVAKPYGLEEQCSLLENLIESALDQHERIHRRL